MEKTRTVIGRSGASINSAGKGCNNHGERQSSNGESRRRGDRPIDDTDVPACLFSVPSHPWPCEQMYDENCTPWYFDPNIGVMPCSPRDGAGDGAYSYTLSRDHTLIVVPNAQHGEMDERRRRRALEAFMRVRNAIRVEDAKPAASPVDLSRCTVTRTPRRTNSRCDIRVVAPDGRTFRSMRAARAALESTW